MLSRRQEALTFAAALALHLFVLWFVRVVVGERVSAPSAFSPPNSELAFDVELGEPVVTDQQRGAAPEARAPEPRSARWSGRARSLESALEAAEQSVDDAASEESGLETTLEDETPARRIDLGIGPDGWRRWVTPPKTSDAPRVERRRVRANRYQVFRAPPVSTTGGVQEGLEERDLTLGLGPAGRVLSALHNAAHQTVAPSVGTARFDVKVSRTGAVEVTLGHASGEAEAWRKVAAHIADDLRASPPRIPPPRDGVRLVVELVAEETLPNGTKVSSLTNPHVEVIPPKLESTERSVKDLAEQNPTTENPAASGLPPIKLDLPGVYLAERGKVCSYRLGVSALGPVFQGGCDPSHIGAKPQRMVRARVVEQSMF